jgi:D-alanyl-lipoteichoic acid acyltransferase DltB (MBOAT superfamily)
LLAFLVSGIWHGSTWGFVVWGAMHGVFLACSVYYRPLQKELHKRLGIDRTTLLKIWQIVVTFQLVSFAWIFFRANSIHDAVYIVSNILNGSTGFKAHLLHVGIVQFVLSILGIVLVLLTECFLKSSVSLANLFQNRVWFRWGVYYAMLAAILFVPVEGDGGFLYTRF